MKLNQKQFNDFFDGKRLRIALVGMSNVGKSFRAKQLEEELSFQRICVDDLIEKKLDLKGIQAVARWMGFPHEVRYLKAEVAYLAAEEKVMARMLEEERTEGNQILDTTGSVIYLPPNLLERLRESYLIVHLDVPDEMIPEMTDRFFAHPKPVIWKGMFAKQPKESIEVALRRSYPAWLRFRLAQYRELADVALLGEISRDQDLSAAGFLGALREVLES